MGFQHIASYRQCTATSKRSKQRCKNPAIKGRTCCRMHGGKSPRGIASPSTAHGYYSQSTWYRFIWSEIKISYRAALVRVRLDAHMERTRQQGLPSIAAMNRRMMQARAIIKQCSKDSRDIPAQYRQQLYDAWQCGQLDAAIWHMVDEQLSTP